MELEFFRYDQLPERLQKISRPFSELAAQILVMCPDVDQRALALQNLLTAKDCAVRAALKAKP